MNKKSIKWILFLTIIYAQDYTLDHCIQIAIDGKKTVLSAELGVVSASKGLKASYSGLLPSVQAATSAGQTRFPEIERHPLTDYDLLTHEAALQYLHEIKDSFLN